MNFSGFDYALVFGMAALFGLYRYTHYRRTDPDRAVSKAAADFAKGAAGLLVITVVQKLVLSQ
jgi:hypothetical protein